MRGRGGVGGWPTGAVTPPADSYSEVRGTPAAGVRAWGVRCGPGPLWPLLGFAGVGAQVPPEVSAQFSGSRVLQTGTSGIRFVLLLKKLLFPKVPGGIGFSYLRLYEAWLPYSERQTEDE